MGLETVHFLQAPGYASSACLVTMILCSKVLEDPGLKKKKKHHHWLRSLLVYSIVPYIIILSEFAT